MVNDAEIDAAVLRLAQTRLAMAEWLARDAAARAEQQNPDLAVRAHAAAKAASATLPNRLAGLMLNAVAERLLHPGDAAASPAQVLRGAAQDGALTLLRPVAQRHPWALVGSAALVGAALMALRPRHGLQRWLQPALLGRLALPWLLRSLAQAAQQKPPPPPQPPI